VIARIRSQISFADLSPRGGTTLNIDIQSSMRDEKIVRERLEQLRGQFLQWGTPDLMVFVTTKDELRGWIRALEWALQLPSAKAGSATEGRHPTGNGGGC